MELIRNIILASIFVLPILCINCSQAEETIQTDKQSLEISTKMENEIWPTADPNSNYSLVYVNASDYENHHLTNTTTHRGFLHGFVESLSVILISELGDKTFFIAAIMAMTSNKLTVFLGAISALALMTVLSALLGFAVTAFIPRKYIYYASAAIMFLFGLKMLWDAWKMKPDEAEEIQHEVEEELQRRGSIASNRSNQGNDEDIETASNDSHTEDDARNLENTPLRVLNESESQTGVSEPVKIKKRVTIQEKSAFGKKCYKVFKVFMNCFTMTILAEWGDRSQIATIVLAGVNDVVGVIVGGVLGHSICTGLAVVAGALVAKKISVRVVTFIGALVFIGFAIAALFIDPESEEPIQIDMS